MAKKQNMVILGVFSMFLATQFSIIINPMLASLAAKYSDIPYSTVLLLSTINGLLSAPASMICGAIAGVKVSYRKLCLFSLALILIGGMGPYFYDSFYFTLSCRAIVGLGIGFSSPMGNALVMQLYEGKKQASMQGAGTTFMNACGVVLQYLAGVLCAVSVKNAWLLHLLLIVMIIAVYFYLPEPQKAVSAADAKTDKQKEKGRLTPFIAYDLIIFSVVFLFFYPCMLNISSVLEAENLGNASVAGTITAAYTLGGMFIGFVLGKLYNTSGKFCRPILIGIHILAMGIAAYGKSVPFLFVSFVLMGISVFGLWPASILDWGKSLSPAGVTLASGLISGGMAVAGFLSSSYVGLIINLTKSTEPRTPIVVSFFATVILAGIWLVTLVLKKEPKPAANEAA